MNFPLIISHLFLHESKMCDQTIYFRSLMQKVYRYLILTSIETASDMDTSIQSTPKSYKKGNINCMAPGCTNYKSKTDENVHYHRVPKDNEKLCNEWINKMKLANPPKLQYARVCSAHFTDEDYELKGSFEDGRFVQKKSSKLIANAVPLLFDFSGYQIGATDAPSFSTPSPSARSQRQSRRVKEQDIKNVQEDIHKELSQPSPLLQSDELYTIPDIQECHAASYEKVMISVGTQADIPCIHDLITRIKLDHTYTKYSKPEPLTKVKPNIKDNGQGTSKAQTIPVTLSKILPQPKIMKEREGNTPNDVKSSHISLDDIEEYDIDNGFEYKESCSETSDTDPTCEMEVEDDIDSLYEPSCEDWTDSDSDMSSDCDNPVNPLNDAKYIIHREELLKLFSICNEPGCGKPAAEDPKVKTKGSAMQVTSICLDGHTFTWKSQPYINNIPACNLLLPTAVFLTGNSFTSVLEIFDTINLTFLSERQCYNIQSGYIIPEVEKIWGEHIESIMASVCVNPVVVSGDARCDSPGHNATFGTYTMLDTASHLILAQETVKVTEVKNSYWLEPEGLERCLAILADHGVIISQLATDRHPSVQKIMRESYPEIKHEYDLWHIVKGIKKKLSASKDSDLVPWINAVANHMWHSAANCNKDASLLKEKWISLLHHITNNHSWLSGDNFHACDHPPYTPLETKSRPWLEKTSKAFAILQGAVLKKQLLTSLEKVR